MVSFIVNVDAVWLVDPLWGAGRHDLWTKRSATLVTPVWALSRQTPHIVFPGVLGIAHRAVVSDTKRSSTVGCQGRWHACVRGSVGCVWGLAICAFVFVLVPPPTEPDGGMYQQPSYAPRRCFTSSLTIVYSEMSGRVMVCSRGLLFEPDDIKHPLTKFPFRYMDVAPRVSKRDAAALKFSCTQVVRMKKNGVVGPYTLQSVTRPAPAGGAGAGAASSSGADGGKAKEDAVFAIALKHSTAADVLALVTRLWNVVHESRTSHRGRESDLLQPLLYERHMVRAAANGARGTRTCPRSEVPPTQPPPA